MALTDLNARLGLIVDPFNKAVRDTERSLRRFQRRVGAIGRDLTQSITLPLVGVGAAGVKLAFDLEKTFGTIENLVGVTGDDLQSLKDAIPAISSEVGKSQQELAEALFTITSAGFGADDALKVLESSAKASVIGLGETETVAKAVGAAVTAYGKDVLSAADATNILAATVRAGNLEASSLAPNLGNVIPIAAELGVSFQEVGANIATFTRLGVSAENAITGLNSVLSGLLKPTTQGTEALAQYGLSYKGLRDSIEREGLFETLVKLKDSFGDNTEELAKVIPNVRALKTVLGTVGAQTDEYREILRGMSENIDIVGEGFEKVSETSAQKFENALNKLRNATIEIGEIIIPVVTRVIDSLSGIIDSFNALEPSTKKTIVNFGLVAAAVGPMLIAISKLSSVALLATGGLSKLIGGMAFLAVSVADPRAAILRMGGSFKVLTTSVNAFKAALGPVHLALAALSIAVGVGLAAWNEYQDGVQRVEEIQSLIPNTMRAAEKSIAAERVELNKVSTALINSNLGYDARKKAIESLQKINPQYFADLNAEESSIGDINEKLETYNNLILKRAQLRAAEEKLVDIEKQLLSVVEDTEEAGLSFSQTLVAGFNAFKIYGEGAGFATKRNELLGQNIRQRKDDLEAMRDALVGTSAQLNKELAGTGLELSVPTVTGGTVTPPVTDQDNKEADKIIAKTKELGAEIQKVPPLSTLQNLPQITQGFEEIILGGVKFKGVAETFGLSGEEAALKIKSGLDQTGAAFDSVAEKFAATDVFISQLGFSINSLGEATFDFAQAGSFIINQIGEGFAAAVSGVQSFAQVFKKTSAVILGELVKIGIAAAIKNTLLGPGGKLGPIGVAIAAAAGLAAKALFGRLVGLAEGGIVPPGFPNDTFPARLTSGEAVIPLDRLKTMIGGGEPGTVIAEARVSGDDLLILIKQAEARNIRFAG